MRNERREFKTIKLLSNFSVTFAGESLRNRASNYSVTSATTIPCFPNAPTRRPGAESNSNFSGFPIVFLLQKSRCPPPRTVSIRRFIYRFQSFLNSFPVSIVANIAVSFFNFHFRSRSFRSFVSNNVRYHSQRRRYNISPCFAIDDFSVRYDAASMLATSPPQ